MRVRLGTFPCFQIQVKYAMHIVLIYAKENEATRSRFEPIRKLALYSPSAHVYIHAQCCACELSVCPFTKNASSLSVVGKSEGLVVIYCCVK